MVDLQSEFSVAVESMERRGCDLQVELAEWKEKAEAERLQRCTVEEELATAHRQHDDLQRTIDAQLAEIERSATLNRLIAAPRRRSRLSRLTSPSPLPLLLPPPRRSQFDPASG